MSDKGNRWWEGYLVRYFVPALLGFFIVRWIVSLLPAKHSVLLVNSQSVNAPIDLVAMVSVVALGFLYCYISSYPILVFHATRVIDFRNAGNATEKMAVNPYISSVVFCILVYSVAVLYYLYIPWWVAFSLMIIVTAAYSFIQCFRLYICWSDQGQYLNNTTVDSSIGYAFTYKLARRRTRSETEEVITTNQRSPNSSVCDGNSIATDASPQQSEQDDGKTKKSKNISFYGDISESYRHLREHGNTAFIVLLEVALCPVVLVSLHNDEGYLYMQYVVPVLLIWVLPSVFVHWYAQHIERRFSLFR